MYIHIPWFDWVPVVGGPLLAAGLFIVAMMRAARTTQPSAGESRNVITGVAAFLALWFVSYAYFAANGVFSARSAVPILPIALLLPLAIAIMAFKTLPSLRSILEKIPQEHLTGIQGIRLMGFAFLLLLVQSLLPAVFALPAGLGDMLVGAEAIFVARAYAARSAAAPFASLLMNVTGLADFVVALAIGFLAATTPLQLIHVTPNTNLVTMLPLALVPTFGVPLFVVLHALSLGRVRSELSRSRSAVAPAA